MMFHFTTKKLKRQSTEALAEMINIQTKDGSIADMPSAASLVASVWSREPLTIGGKKMPHPHFTTVAFEGACFGAANENLSADTQRSLLKVAVSLAKTIKGKHLPLDDTIVEVGLQHLQYTPAFKALQT